MAQNPVLKTNSDSIQLYEVIRVIDAIPLFLEDHLDRLYHSASLTQIDQLPSLTSLSEMIKQYILDQKQKTGNIRLSFSLSDPSFAPQCEMNFIAHYYPTPQEYTRGVKVGLLNAVRPIPQAKVQNRALRDRANKKISENGFFEVLLVDSEGHITEGSRTNVFFIKNGMLYSSPVENILQGITRLKVMQLCQNAGIKVIESAIDSMTLDQYEATFLTGTSPMILPIYSIDNIIYKTDSPVLIRLRKLYDQLIENYIEQRR
jgi:branched-chain amino acid aminotransferase